MPRVNTQKKSTRGRERRCGRAGCGRAIEPGEVYYSFTFRYGGTQVRCNDHYPRQSELTQSKLATIYSAIEDVEDRLDAMTTEDEMIDAVQEVSQAVQEVADEYREADEALGGYGATESAQRADDLEAWASDLDGFQPNTDVPEYDPEDDPDEPGEDASVEDRESYEEELAERERDKEEYEQALEDLRDEVREAINECPV